MNPPYYIVPFLARGFVLGSVWLYFHYGDPARSPWRFSMN